MVYSTLQVRKESSLAGKERPVKISAGCQEVLRSGGIYANLRTPVNLVVGTCTREKRLSNSSVKLKLKMLYFDQL